MREFRVRTIGPKESSTPCLNVVLAHPRIAFNDLHYFAEHVRTLAAMPESNHLEPHLLLFPEAPFRGGKFATRKEVKQAIRSLRDLFESRPSLRVAFSVNEVSRRVHSNTGHVLGNFGGNKWHLAYSKIELAHGDIHAIGERKMHLLPATIDHSVFFLDRPPRPNVDGEKSHWLARGQRFLRRFEPFPLFSFGTGHTCEFRVCVDASIKGVELEGVTKLPSVQVVSADGLPKNDVPDGLLPIIVNDSDYPHRFLKMGSRVFHFDQHGLDEKSLERLLASKSIRVHLVD